MSETVSVTSDLDRLDVGEIWRFLKRRWKVVLGAALGCATMALTVCLLMRPAYTATSQVLLDPHRPHIFGQESVAPDSALDSSIVDSQISIITSTRLLAKVISKENLADDPEFAASAKAGWLRRLFALFRPARVQEAEQPSLDGIDPKQAPVVLNLFNRIEVTRIAKSYVLSVSVSSRDPAKATRLANSLAETYVEDQIDVRAKSVQQAAAFFEDRLGSLRDQVRESERAVADFRRKHDLTTTTMDGKVTVGEQQLQNLNEQLALAATDTAEKLARYQQAARFKDVGSNVETLPEVIRSPVIAQLRAQQADLLRRQSDLAATYGPAYPAIAQIHAQRGALDRAIAAEVHRLVATLRNDYEVAGAREAALRNSIAGLTDVSGGDNEIGVKLRELERTNLANKALFENFLNRAKLTQEQSSFEEPDARLISPALQPTLPTSPKTKLIVLVSALVGLILGLGAAAAADTFYVRGIDRTEMTLRRGAYILGRLPAAGPYLPDGGDLDAYIAAEPRSTYARSVEDLAARLLSVVQCGRSLAVCPLESDSDATRLVIAVAIVLGREGHRVLLIDADHKRDLSRAFDAGDKPGFGDVIAGELSATKAGLVRPRFVLLPAGQRRVEPTSAHRLRAFLEEARGRFDLIILKTPALADQADRRRLDELFDGLVLVACCDGLMHDDFVAAVDAMADTPNFLGVVLTRTDRANEREFALAS